MVARCSRDWGEAPASRRQANAISERAVELATRTARAWEEALTRSATPKREATTTRGADFSLEQKLEAAAAAPLEIASLGADVAALAALAGQHGDATYRADAAAAAALAAGGAAAAAYLVRVNLGVRTSDPGLPGHSRASRRRSDVGGSYARIAPVSDAR